jgi:hypothetical protein
MSKAADTKAGDPVTPVTPVQGQELSDDFRELPEWTSSSTVSRERDQSRVGSIREVSEGMYDAFDSIRVLRKDSRGGSGITMPPQTPAAAAAAAADKEAKRLKAASAAAAAAGAVAVSPLPSLAASTAVAAATSIGQAAAAHPWMGVVAKGAVDYAAPFVVPALVGAPVGVLAARAIYLDKKNIQNFLDDRTLSSWRQLIDVDRRDDRRGNIRLRDEMYESFGKGRWYGMKDVMQLKDSEMYRKWWKGELSDDKELKFKLLNEAVTTLIHFITSETTALVTKPFNDFYFELFKYPPNDPKDTHDTKYIEEKNRYDLIYNTTLRERRVASLLPNRLDKESKGVIDTLISPGTYTNYGQLPGIIDSYYNPITRLIVQQGYGQAQQQVRSPDDKKKSEVLRIKKEEFNRLESKYQEQVIKGVSEKYEQSKAKSSTGGVRKSANKLIKESKGGWNSLRDTLWPPSQPAVPISQVQPLTGSPPPTGSQQPPGLPPVPGLPTASPLDSITEYLKRYSFGDLSNVINGIKELGVNDLEDLRYLERSDLLVAVDATTDITELDVPILIAAKEAWIVGNPLPSSPPLITNTTLGHILRLAGIDEEYDLISVVNFFGEGSDATGRIAEQRVHLDLNVDNNDIAARDEAEAKEAAALSQNPYELMSHEYFPYLTHTELIKLNIKPINSRRFRRMAEEAYQQETISKVMNKDDPHFFYEVRRQIDKKDEVQDIKLLTMVGNTFISKWDDNISNDSDKFKIIEGMWPIYISWDLEDGERLAWDTGRRDESGNLPAPVIDLLTKLNGFSEDVYPIKIIFNYVWQKNTQGGYYNAYTGVTLQNQDNDFVEVEQGLNEVINHMKTWKAGMRQVGGAGSTPSITSNSNADKSSSMKAIKGITRAGDADLHNKYLKFMFTYSLLCDLVKIYRNTKDNEKDTKRMERDTQKAADYKKKIELETEMATLKGEKAKAKAIGDIEKAKLKSEKLDQTKKKYTALNEKIQEKAQRRKLSRDEKSKAKTEKKRSIDEDIANKLKAKSERRTERKQRLIDSRKAKKIADIEAKAVKDRTKQEKALLKKERSKAALEKREQSKSKKEDIQGIKEIKDTIDEEVKKGEAKKDEVTDDETREGEAKKDEVTDDETRKGEATYDETREGEVREGEVREGEVREGEVKEEEGILTKLSNLLFGKETDEDQVDAKGAKSYTPVDRSAKELVSVTKQELVELRKTEERLEKQIKQDKLNYMTRYSYVQNLLAQKLKEVDYLEKNTKQTMDSQTGNLQYLRDKLNISVKSKLDIIHEKEKVIENKRLKDKLELDKIHDEYINKLNKAFNTEYKRMKYSYETKHKKQKRILFDLVKDYKGDNASILELRKVLKHQMEIPLMVSGKRTFRRRRLPVVQKIESPEDGVYALMDVIGH